MNRADLAEDEQAGPERPRAGLWSTVQLLFVGAVMFLFGLYVGSDGSADSASDEPRSEQAPMRSFPATATEFRMENMCREAIADRRIRGSVDEAATSALGVLRDVGFGDTPWAHADARYAIGDWEADGPTVDHAIVGPGDLRELHHWEMRARFGAASSSDPGALFGWVWCLLIVDPSTEAIWFRCTGQRPAGSEAAHYWLEQGEPEALVTMKCLP